MMNSETFSTQFTRVTNETYTARLHIPRYAYASRGKNYWSLLHMLLWMTAWRLASLMPVSTSGPEHNAHIELMTKIHTTISVRLFPIRNNAGCIQRISWPFGHIHGRRSAKESRGDRIEADESPSHSSLPLPSLSFPSPCKDVVCSPIFH